MTRRYVFLKIIISSKGVITELTFVIFSAFMNSSNMNFVVMFMKEFLPTLQTFNIFHSFVNVGYMFLQFVL